LKHYEPNAAMRADGGTLVNVALLTEYDIAVICVDYNSGVIAVCHHAYGYHATGLSAERGTIILEDVVALLHPSCQAERCHCEPPPSESVACAGWEGWCAAAVGVPRYT
jgi:hypothetical protein